MQSAMMQATLKCPVCRELTLLACDAIIRYRELSKFIVQTPQLQGFLDQADRERDRATRRYEEHGLAHRRRRKVPGQTVPGCGRDDVRSPGRAPQ
jgi:hypothetical protein